MISVKNRLALSLEANLMAKSPARDLRLIR